MSKAEDYARKISYEMGYDGELNDAVIEETNRVLLSCGLVQHIMPLPWMDFDIDIEEPNDYTTD